LAREATRSFLHRRKLHLVFDRQIKEALREFELLIDDGLVDPMTGHIEKPGFTAGAMDDFGGAGRAKRCASP